MKVVFGIILALLVPIAGTILTDAPVIWPVSTLIYNLGLLYSFAIVPRRITRIIAYNILATAFFVIEASFFFSYYLQNTGFNEAFFYHIRPDLLYAGMREYLPFIIAMIICLSGLLIMSSSTLAREMSRRVRLIPMALGLLAFGLLISPPVKALVFYVENYSTPKKDNVLFENFTEQLSPKVTVEFTKSERPNIVLIYAESLEQRFFDETLFPGLVPNLKRLKERSINFSNVSQGIGAEWTVGGIVASQCGYPLAGSQGVKDNDLSIFDKFLPKATCLGDLLGNEGYHLTFIGGADARFAGKVDFLASHGYKEILDRVHVQKYLDDKSYHNSWGVFDDTLFDYAIEKFISLSKEKSPFLMTLLTLDPHGSIGYLSKSCNTYLSGDNSSLNSFHCSDQLISRFIEQIRNSPYSENTLIIVLSDHLAMRNKATYLLETSQKPRRLTFFVNTPDSQKQENVNPGLHYDIAPTILDLVGYNIRGQIGFGAPLTQGPGYLPGKFGEDEWVKHSANLIAIASTLWNNDVTLDRNGIKYSASDLTLTLGGREFYISSEGYTNIPASTLFVFNEKSLMLESIKFYSLDRELTPATLGKELLKHKEKLVLAIGLAENLPGFTDPRNKPKERVYFFGKPGSDIYSWGPLTEVLIVPFNIIQELRLSKINDRIVRERENLLKAINRNSTARMVR